MTSHLLCVRSVQCRGGCRGRCRVAHGVPIHGTLGDKPKLVTLTFLTFTLTPDTEKNHSPPAPDGVTEGKRGCNSASFMYLYRFQRLGYRNHGLGDGLRGASHTRGVGDWEIKMKGFGTALLLKLGMGSSRGQ